MIIFMVQLFKRKNQTHTFYEITQMKTTIISQPSSYNTRQTLSAPLRPSRAEVGQDYITVIFCDDANLHTNKQCWLYSLLHTASHASCKERIYHTFERIHLQNF